ncbi:MAG: hypothetical protein M5U28_34765 [Sandaracinaceae bacterium]|nr:hypothetical protein [Sandaracinaceae bacterium]
MRIVIRSLVALFVLLIEATALGQARCEHSSYDEDGFAVVVTRYELDAEGRITAIDYENDAAAFGSRTVRRYAQTGELVEERVQVLEGPDESAIGWSAPIPVRTERAGEVVTVTRTSARPELAGVERWTFDERGLPSRVEVEPSSFGGELPEVRTCAFDLAGRPVYSAGFEGETLRNERRFVWSGDALDRVVVAWSGHDGSTTEERHRVRRRGAEIEMVGPEGVVESWRGACDALLYGLCAPIHAPPSGRARPSLPPPSGPRAGRPRGSGGVAFPEAVLRAPMTLASLRAAYPSRVVWTTHGFYENAPDVPFAFVCVGRGDRCLTRIEHGEDGRARRAETADPALAGPSGVRVGMRYARAAPRLEPCERRLGLEEGIACRLRDAPHVEAWLDPPTHLAEELARGGEDAPPTPEMLTGRIVRLVWAAGARAD